MKPRFQWEIIRYLTQDITEGFFYIIFVFVFLIVFYVSTFVSYLYFANLNKDTELS